jgi:hypothetical protein
MTEVEIGMAKKGIAYFINSYIRTVNLQKEGLHDSAIPLIFFTRESYIIIS